MAEGDRKWERIEEADKTTLVIGFNQLKYYLLALIRITEDLTPPQRQLRAHRQAVSYLMVDTSGLGSGSVFWGQGKLFSESR